MAETEDTISLGGTTFYTDGPTVGKPASEWTSGMKVGKATYDERLHAFWLVLDDFSGGIGHRRLDIREGIGTVWDNVGGVDITRAGRVVLPPLAADITPGNAPGNNEMRLRVPSKPWCQSALGASFPTTKGNIFFGIGDSLFYTDENRAAVTRADILTTGAGTDAGMISAVFEFYDGTNHRLFYCGEGDNADTTLRSCTVPTGGSSNWGDASSKVIEDAFPWPGIGGEHGVIIGTTPIAKVIFSADGASWNDDDADDASPLFYSGVGRVTFIGVAMGPWGGPGLYFHNDGKLYCLSYYARQAVPIDLGPAFKVLNGAIFQGGVYVTDGINVLLYNAGASETVRPLGVRYKDGLPPALSNGYIRAIFDGGDFLYGVWVDSTNHKMRLLRFTGVGWTPLGSEVDSAHGWFGCIDYLPDIGWPKTRHLWLPYTNTDTGTTLKFRHYTLPLRGEHPVVGVDSFQDDESDTHFIIGWIDGGFSEVDGCLYRMEIDGFNLGTNEYVKVEFQLDNDESGSWTQLKDSGGSNMVFDALTDVGYFTATNPTRGLEFRTVRFRVTLVRGSTATKSPELGALILLYDKKPEQRAVWSFRVDVSRMIERDATEGTPTYDQFSDVWDAITTLWNTKTLVNLTIPNVWSGNVKLQNMVATVDDYRNDVKGQGYIDVVCLEAV